MNGIGRCMRLPDGRFHLYKRGPLANLFWGGYILVSEALAAVLRDTCAHCVDLRRTELVQFATGENFGTYYEVIPHDEFTPNDIGKVSPPEFHAWHFHRENLFVSPEVAERIRQQGFIDLSFSPGFSGWAGGAA